jgi:hypothetical protein
VSKSHLRDLRRMRISLCFASRFPLPEWSASSDELAAFYSGILPPGNSGGQQRSEPWRYLKIRSRGQNEICAGLTTRCRPRLSTNVQTAVSSRAHITSVAHVATMATKRSSRWLKKSIWTKTQRNFATKAVGDTIADSRLGE